MGPTASGKSALGIELALRFGGEIINCDSVQVYREIEIATAKVPFGERRGVPHHLIDFVPPHVRYTAGAWARDACRVIGEIEARGRLPIIVGGTGLYLRALREPFFASLPTDEQLRSRLTLIRERRGAQYLHRILRRVDPQTAARLHPADWSRITRALEVRFQIKRTINEQRTVAIASAETHAESARLRNRLHILALDPPRDALYERINQRTLLHFQQGLIEEVRGLLERRIPPQSSALGAHGYRRAVEYLRGSRTLKSAVEQTQIDVRRYAKRQWTWFRRESGVEWITGFGDDPRTIERVIARIADLLAAPRGE
jgi:tRNA dimethylallyltransferase